MVTRGPPNDIYPPSPYPRLPLTDNDDQLHEARNILIGETITQGIEFAGGFELAGRVVLVGSLLPPPRPDTDMFKHTVAAGQRIGFDLDRTAVGSLDSYLRVFDVTDAELAANDDGAAPGETAGSESYIKFTFATAGTFYVGVSSSANRTYNAVTGTGDASGSTGGYTLTLSVR